MSDDETQRLYARAMRAITLRVQDSNWRRTHCTVTLAQTGPGVAHNAFIAHREPRVAIWSKAAYEAVHPLTGPSPSTSRTGSNT